MGYNLYFNICGIIFLAVQLITNSISNRLPSRINSIFKLFTTICLISVISNTISASFNILFPNGGRSLKTTITLIDLLLINSIAPSYFFFTLSLVYDQIDFKSKHWLLVVIPYSIMIIAILTSPFTNFVFHLDENDNYIFGPGTFPFYFMNLYFIIISISEIIAHRDRCKNYQLITICAVSFVSAFIVIFQMINPTYLLIGFASAIAIYIFHYSVRNPKELMNFNTDTYNRTAFKEYFFFNQKKIAEQYFCLVHVKNFDMISKTYGTTNSYNALKQQIEELKKKNNIKYVFNIFHNGFLFSCKSLEEATKVVEMVHNFDPSPLKETNNSENSLFHVVYQTDFYILTNAEKLYEDQNDKTYTHFCDLIIELFKYATQIKTGSKCINYLDDKFLADFESAKKRQHTIHNAIENQSFEVFFQPIFNLQSNSFTGAESLLRLKDENDHYISPALFIPDAEKDGSILKLGEISLRKTCEYIIEAQVRERGISKVNVNLSMVQCMQDNIVQTLVSILDEYNIPKTMIRFEITESIMVSDPERLKTVMNDLRDYGIEFALDDYGTGYSNTSMILSFPFTEIKFDKSFLNKILVDKKNENQLQHLMNMVNEADMITLVEGVEDQETSEMIRSFGGNLIQGFYYSEPLPLAEFTLMLPLPQEKNDSKNSQEPRG